MYKIVCSRPRLLKDIREGIKLNILSKTANGTHIIDIASIDDECRLFVFALQEILRMRSIAASLRSVSENTLLASRYVLKSGGIELGCKFNRKRIFGMESYCEHVRTATIHENHILRRRRRKGQRSPLFR